MQPRERYLQIIRRCSDNASRPTGEGKKFTTKTFNMIDEAGASLPKEFEISRSSQDGDQRCLVKHVEHLERFYNFCGCHAEHSPWHGVATS